MRLAETHTQIPDLETAAHLFRITGLTLQLEVKVPIGLDLGELVSEVREITHFEP